MLFSKIMITGCGGDIGFGIGKILKKLDIAGGLVGCDISEDHPGKAIFDQCYVVEAANSPSYIDSILSIVAKEKIDLVIPASEIEIRQLYKNNFYNQKDLFLTANDEALEVGFDKWNTVEMLKNAGLPYPWTQVVSEGEPKKLPCIVKSRHGRGSREVAIANNQEDVKRLKSMCVDGIWQEYLKPDDEEYTCGLYRGAVGETRTIIIKRKLKGGCTGSGVVAYHKEIDLLLKKVANLLHLRGSINVQLRLTKNGPVIFEINPRFSSTVVFRHLLGFQDLLWSIQDKFGAKCKMYDTGGGGYVVPSPGIKFYRTYSEVILDNE